MDRHGGNMFGFAKRAKARAKGFCGGAGHRGGGYGRFAATLLAASAAACALAVQTIEGTRASGLAITQDTRLTGNLTVDGAITVAPGATLDLNGYEATAKGLQGLSTLTYGGVAYEPLEYVEVNGTQYVVTDYTPVADDRVEAQVAFTKDEGDYYCVCSSRASDGSNSFSMFRTGSNSGAASHNYALRFDYGTYSGGERFLLNLGDKARTSAGIIGIVMDTGCGAAGLNYTGSLRGEDPNSAPVASNSSLPKAGYSTFTKASGPLALFANVKWENGGATIKGVDLYAKLKFYWLEIVNNNGVACRLIPAKRLSDSVPGILNTVTGGFFVPRDNKTFTSYGALPASETTGGVISGGLSHAADLTVADASRVTSEGTLLGGYTAATLFNNKYRRNPVGDAVTRIIGERANLPLKVDYDFGDGTPQIVRAYKVYSQQVDSSYVNRAPKSWKFYGSNDKTNWTELDSRTSETGWATPEQRTYTFENETAYRWYRIEFLDNNGGSHFEMTQLEYFENTNVSKLHIDVAAGETATCSGVALEGDIQMVKEGEGSLMLCKTWNSGFGGAGKTSLVVAEGYAAKTGKAPCGAAYSTIEVRDGAQFDLGGDSYGYYDYDITGSGPEGATVPGALVNNTAMSDAWNNKRFMRNITLSGDATIGGSANIGIDFGTDSATIALNGNTLTFEMATAATMIYATGTGWTGPGEVAVSKGRFRFTMADLPVTSGDISLRILDGGVFDAQNSSFTAPLENFTFAAGAKYQHDWNDAYTVPVIGTYAPNIDNAVYNASSTYDLAPKVRLGAEGDTSTTLDLSLFTQPFNASTLSYYVDSSSGEKSQVTVNIGSREIQPGRIATWAAEPQGVEFILAGDGTYVEDNELYLSAYSDGLYVETAAEPKVVRWDATAGEWKFYKQDGVTPWTLPWGETITGNMNIHIASLAEYTAIAARAATLSPSKFVLESIGFDSGMGEIDLTGLDLYANYNLEIDIKGNTLKLPASMTGGAAPFTVTNSLETIGTLEIPVASGETVSNGAMAIGGAVRVVKTGEGTFVAAKARQTYTGGTLVKQGTLRFGMHAQNLPFGPADSQIAVSTFEGTPAVLEIDGWLNYNNYNFVLDGGRLQNSTYPRGGNAGHPDWDGNLRSITLTADSSYVVNEYSGFCIDAFGATTLDLGGHTLDVTIASGKELYLFGTQISAGTVVFNGAGAARFSYSGGYTAPNARNADIVMNSPFIAYHTLSVHDYTARFSSDVNYSTVAMNVYGTFKPSAHNYFYGCTLQNGATLDLSLRETALSTVSAFSGGRKTVTFASGATINLSLNAASNAIRALSKHKNAAGEHDFLVVDWSATADKPASSVNFVLDAASSRRYRIERRENGILLYPRAGMTIVIK